MRWIGRISYGAYVLHDILHNWYATWSAAFFQRFTNILVRHVSPRFAPLQALQIQLFPVLGFGITLLLAWLSFRFFETPFLKLKDRWTIRA